MEILIPLVFITLMLFLFYQSYKKSLMAKREILISTYRFPETIGLKIKEKHPQLTTKQASTVVKGLREYFHVCNTSGRKMVSMPSQVIDDAWHEFILFTREYEYFCHKALGRFLHHTPAEAMKSPTIAQKGIKRGWRISCVREGIDPRAPLKLPLIFSMDAQLGIKGGYTYSLNCRNGKNSDFCAGHIGCGSGCAGGCGGDSSSGGCGGGCGGD